MQRNHEHTEEQGEMQALSDVITIENLMSKAEKLRDRSFRPGFDKTTPEAAILWLQINGQKLVDALLNGQYEPLWACSAGSMIHSRCGADRKGSTICSFI